jgi:hypothetical protein
MLGWNVQGIVGAKSVSCRVRVVAMTGRDAGGKADGDGRWEEAKVAAPQTCLPVAWLLLIQEPGSRVGKFIPLS